MTTSFEEKIIKILHNLAVWFYGWMTNTRSGRFLIIKRNNRLSNAICKWAVDHVHKEIWAEDQTLCNNCGDSLGIWGNNSECWTWCPSCEPDKEARHQENMKVFFGEDSY